jgi:putative endonuclease
MYYVYVLKAQSSGSIYIGHTLNLESRVISHKRGWNQATKGISDWELVYNEEYPTRALAAKREKFLKTGDGRKVLRLKGIL